MKRIYIVLGAILIALVLLSFNVKAMPINNISVDFEKEVYTTLYGTSLKINYTLNNNNEDRRDVLLYLVCDDDVLSCDLSRVFNLNGNSSINSSFIVKTEDYGTSNVRVYVKDIKTDSVKDYFLKIDVDRYNDDGRFEVDVSSRSICRNETKEIKLLFDRVYRNDIYNLSFSGNQLIANIKGSNTKYLYSDVEVPVSLHAGNLSEGFYTLTLNISNDEIFTKKEFDIYVIDCPDPVTVDFSVTGVLTQTHVLKKEEPLTLEFTVKNISNKNKHLFISQESDDVLDIKFSNRELKLSPGESKVVEITFLAKKEISSGDYAVKVSFFDEKTVVRRNFLFLVQPESNLSLRLLQTSILLEIGKSFDLGLVIENKGDLQETLYFDLTLSNDIRHNNPIDRVVLNPNTSTSVLFNLSAGPNTQETSSNIQLRVYNQRGDFQEVYNLNVNTFRQRDVLKLEFLAFPNQMSIQKNSVKDFSFEVYNFDTQNISISKVDITGLPQEITYEIRDYTFIPRNQSRTITGSFNVGDAAVGEYVATIIFYSSTGAIITKDVIINITDEIVDYQDPDDGYIFPITGFFTLGSSILLGIILLSLLLIILFSTGVIKTKHRNYTKN